MWFSLRAQLSFGFKGNTDLMVTDYLPSYRNSQENSVKRGHGDVNVFMVALALME